MWHIHISFYRAYSEDHAALQQVAAVFTGSGVVAPPESADEFEAMIMAWYKDKKEFEAAQKKIAIEAALEVVRKEGIPGNAAAAAIRAKEILERMEQSK